MAALVGVIAPRHLSAHEMHLASPAAGGKVSESVSADSNVKKLEISDSFAISYHSDSITYAYLSFPISNH